MKTVKDTIKAREINSGDALEKYEEYMGRCGEGAVCSISAYDLDIDDQDITGYIYKIDGVLFAEALDEDGNGRYFEGTEIDELQKLLTDAVYSLKHDDE